MTGILTIDLGAVVANWRALDVRHSGATAGVIKADAYGLGAAMVAPALYAAGCRNFFVAHLAEAVAVRGLVPEAMVGVLNGMRAADAAEFAAGGITPVVGTFGELAAWRAQAGRVGRVLDVILHFDTGMSRLGFDVSADVSGALEGLRVAYVMTHLVSADMPGDLRNAGQVTAFAAVCARFPGVKRSFANSSGMFLGEPFASDLARPGAAVYGINPAPGSPNVMRPVVRLTAPILQVRDLQAGETVGYNGFWTAARNSRIAVLGVGYADGFFRALTNKATARFDGTVVPLVGRVSMDIATFDITDTAADAGDELVLIGDGHGADDLALEAGTNGYEILTALGRRYQRRYIGG
jgi:alanine racemase